MNHNQHHSSSLGPSQSVCDHTPYSTQIRSTPPASEPKSRSESHNKESHTLTLFDDKGLFQAEASNDPTAPVTTNKIGRRRNTPQQSTTTVSNEFTQPAPATDRRRKNKSNQLTPVSEQSQTQKAPNANIDLAKPTVPTLKGPIDSKQAGVQGGEAATVSAAAPLPKPHPSLTPSTTSANSSQQATTTTTSAEEAPAPPSTSQSANHSKPSDSKVSSDQQPSGCLSDAVVVADSEPQPSTSAAAASQAPSSKPLRVTLRLCAAAASKLRRLALHNPRTLRKLGITTVKIQSKPSREDSATGNQKSLFEFESFSKEPQVIRLPQRLSPSPPRQVQPAQNLSQQSPAKPAQSVPLQAQSMDPNQQQQQYGGMVSAFQAQQRTPGSSAGMSGGYPPAQTQMQQGHMCMTRTTPPTPGHMMGPGAGHPVQPQTIKSMPGTPTLTQQQMMQDRSGYMTGQDQQPGPDNSSPTLANLLRNNPSQQNISTAQQHQMAQQQQMQRYAVPPQQQMHGGNGNVQQQFPTNQHPGMYPQPAQMQQHMMPGMSNSAGIPPQYMQHQHAMQMQQQMGRPGMMIQPGSHPLQGGMPPMMAQHGQHMQQIMPQGTIPPQQQIPQQMENVRAQMGIASQGAQYSQQQRMQPYPQYPSSGGYPGAGMQPQTPGSMIPGNVPANNNSSPGIPQGYGAGQQTPQPYGSHQQQSPMWQQQNVSFCWS
ncbi:hypothetical protein Ddc_03454 [Ditylenchus destructor]|nr:hypothetical protein Ddc_03454 [Ditylenchus destructor]